MKTKGTYEIMDGWEASVEERETGLDELVLLQIFNTGFREVWRMQIPPKMPEADLISQARMLADLYQRAWTLGVNDARDHMAEAVKYLIEETGGWGDGDQD